MSRNKFIINQMNGNEKEYIRQDRKNSIMLFFFYTICFVGFIGFVLTFISNRFDYYLIDKSVLLTSGSDYQLEFLPVYADNFKIEDLTFTVDDSSIVSVDKYGRLTALKNGITNIRIKHKYMIETKQMEIKVDNLEVNSISINDTASEEIVVEKQKTIKIIPNINGDKKVKTKVKYRTNNSNIATIDDFGNLTAKNEGKVLVVVEGENGVKDEKTIVVKASNEEIETLSFARQNETIKTNESKMLDVNTTPPAASMKNVKWESNNSNVVLVDQNGKITGLKSGSAIVSVKNTTNGISSNIIVNVEDELTINSTNKSIKVGDYYTLKSNKSVTWSSSNAKVASIDSFGTVVGVGEGTATITGKYNNQTVKCVINVEKKTIDVTSVIIDKTDLIMYVDDSIKLNAIVEPNNANNKNLTWESSNNTIVVVDSSGKITAKKIGSATIIAKSTNGRKAEARIKVISKPIPSSVEPSKVDVTSININKTKVDLYENETLSLIATINPNNATNKSITWSSSNTGVAIVDKNGKITAKSEGSTTITATTNNNIKSNCVVNVIKKKVDVQSVGLNKSSVDIYVNESVIIIATISPNNATNKFVTWSSSNTSVATVDSNGKVIAKKSGTTNITAKTNNGKTASVKVTVKDKTINSTSISLNKTGVILYENDNISLKATVLPSNATNKSVTWKSSNTSVATVDSNGKVTAKKEGSSTITANNGSLSSTCSITVKRKEQKETKITELKMNITNTTIYINDSISLYVSIEPKAASNRKITWSSSNSNVATVDSNGKVTAKKEGQVTITASGDDKKATSIIIVRKKDINLTCPSNGSNQNYDGKEKSTNIKCPNGSTISGQTTGTDAGTYTVKCTASSGYTFGGNSSCIATWKIINNTLTPTTTTPKFVDPVSTGFEITYYWGILADKLTDNDIRNMKAAGITLAQLKSTPLSFEKTSTYRQHMATAINKLKSAGIKVLVTDNYAVYGYFGNDSVYKNDDEALEKVKDMVSYYSQFSNVIGYDICDEPSTKYFNRIKKIVNYIKEKDPKRIAYINLFPNYVYSEAMGASDYYSGYLKKFASDVRPHILSVDHYPSMFSDGDINTSKAKYYTNMNDVRQLANSYNMKPMMISLLTKHLSFKNLTKEEIAFQISMNLAYDMKRISYFTYSVDQIDKDFSEAIVDVNHRTTAHYNDVKEINKWAKSIGDQLYSKKLSNIYGINEVSTLSNYNSSNKLLGNITVYTRWTQSNAPLVVSIFNDNSILLVNTDPENLEESITLDGSQGNLRNMQWYNVDVNRWIDISSPTGDEGGIVWFTPEQQNILLRGGHCILLRKK